MSLIYNRQFSHACYAVNFFEKLDVPGVEESATKGDERERHSEGGGTRETEREGEWERSFILRNKSRDSAARTW